MKYGTYLNAEIYNSPNLTDIYLRLFNSLENDVFTFNFYVQGGGIKQLVLCRNSINNRNYSTLNIKLLDGKIDFGYYPDLKNLASFFIIRFDNVIYENYEEFINLLNTSSYVRFIFLSYNLSIPSYFEIYDNSSTVMYNQITYSTYNFMMSLYEHEKYKTSLLTQNILLDLSNKLSTFDNLNVLANADFTPLLNLSTFADLVGSLNPVLTKQVNALDVLNVYASTLQPVRAKFGQPVEPLSKTDKVYSFIDYNHMTINRLITNQSKNSKIYLYDVSSSKLLKVLYDIDYSMTFDVKDYKSLRIVFDANDYVIDKAL